MISCENFAVRNGVFLLPKEVQISLRWVLLIQSYFFYKDLILITGSKIDWADSIDK